MRYFLAGDGRGHEAGGGQTITPPLSLVALSKPSLEGGRAMQGDDARARAVARPAQVAASSTWAACAIQACLSTQNADVRGGRIAMPARVE
ncbi:hypothetical protein ASD86_23860 [Lysobacter sp. Root690]|nr:hypothetical protein ASD86_23860 [Lysobacter sp. Root690]